MANIRLRVWQKHKNNRFIWTVAGQKSRRTEEHRRRNPRLQPGQKLSQLRGRLQPDNGSRTATSVPTKPTVEETKKRRTETKLKEWYTLQDSEVERIRNNCHYGCQYCYRSTYTQSDSHSRIFAKHAFSSNDNQITVRVSVRVCVSVCMCVLVCVCVCVCVCARAYLYSVAVTCKSAVQKHKMTNQDSYQGGEKNKNNNMYIPLNRQLWRRPTKLSPEALIRD